MIFRELTSLWRSLEDPEYLHLLLEPVPLAGLAFGLLFMIASLVLHDAKMRFVALTVMAAACLTVQPCVGLRLKAEPRILALQDPAFHSIIKQQTVRRTGSTWVYYSVAAVCLLSLVLGRGAKGLIVSVVTIVCCAAGLTHALWLHKKECEVYHRNIVKAEVR